ncbi:hypothetical protein JD844_032462 [Phrynosoma platyrhinos]|uniref:G-protein coupled receptor 126 n=1 Tax=Phrynosoma platyrhinos TaxID=52577 RepID=A0ABQ7T4V6_PHRPL|nr:hypothetical protein JD844_032462 [Phrynosoma platyrhinos]
MILLSKIEETLEPFGVFPKPSSTISVGTAEDGFLGRYRAVFNTSCDDVWTLSPGISVPALTNFTVCVYLKLYSLKHSWTAFVYNKVPDGNASGSNHYELGLTGGHDKLTVWIFGKEITCTEKLDENTWYQVCIRWKSEDQEVSVYINDEKKKTEKISKTRHLLADGQLLLGCSQITGMSSSPPQGMVGELYMFRMWANGGINYTQDCRDGTIIRWRKDNWVFNKTAEYSKSLPCANAVDLSLRTRKTSSTPDSSSETLNPAGTTSELQHFSMTTGIKKFSLSAGTKGLDNNVCNLSALCNDTVFYMGTINFQTSDNSSDTSYNLKVHYHDTNQYQLKPASTALPEMKISEVNKTLQRLSQSYLLQCDTVNESSTSECSFIIKLQKKMNISAMLSYLKEKAEIGQAESCCCSSLDPHFCPSTVEELRLLQCGMHETVACSGSSTQDLPVSPVTPSTVVTHYNAPPSEQDTISPTPLTELTTADISSGSAIQSTNTSLPSTEEKTLVPTSAPPTKSVTSSTSFETTNPFTSTSPVKSTATSVKYSTTPLTVVSTMNISVDVPLTPDKNGSLNKSNTEHVSQNRFNDTDHSNATDFEKIVSQLENNLTAESIAPSFAKSMVDSVSFLLDKPQLQISPMSKRIIQIVDAIGLKLNFSTESISLTSPSLALAVIKVNSSSFNSVSFAVEDSSDLQVVLGTQVPRKSVGAITVPSSVITNLSPEDKHQASRITFNFFEKTTLFQENSTVKCAFWDFSKNGGNGGWAYDGCIVKERRTNETVCSCNHLTSFGVLLDLSRSAPPSPIQVLILTFITYIGCGLSAIFLSVTLVTYIAFEKIRRDYPSKILIQLWVPAIVIVIVLAISPNNYGLGSYGKFPNGSTDEFCWINNNIVFYITVVGYFCMIFLLNISMFIVVLIQLYRIKKKKQLGAQRKTSIQDLRSVAGLTFLLGITWGFAFFAWGPVNLVFMYLFAIFNTLQDWSRTATNGLKKQNVNQGVSSSSHSLQSNSNSTNSTSMLMNNDYSVHANGNGNVSSEKNGVSFNVQNGDVRLPDFSAKQLTFQENNDMGQKKSCISLRRTSKKGSLHFIEPL